MLILVAFKWITAIRQIAALPYRVDKEGLVEVLLITSRDTRRWVVPKGNPIAGLSSHAAAEREAFEEAGVIGTASSKPVGSFKYIKWRPSGRSSRVTVRLFAFAVASRAEVWPEKSERQSRWFKLAEAAAVVAEPELKSLISSFEGPKSAET